jgi:isopentenyldiphosphate isomerase
MSEVEMFDIFSEAMIKIGTDSRASVHAKGQWHQSFHCWIINYSTIGGCSLLFQLRHKDKDTYPGLLDVSCAGHLLSGETVDDGVRELSEELGIALSIDELVHCGMVAEEYIISEQCIDREFNHIFIHNSNKTLEEYNFQISEISGLFYINLMEFQELLSGAIDSILTEGIVFDEVKQNVRSVKREFYSNDFTPKSSEYYRLFFEKIESL